MGELFPILEMFDSADVSPGTLELKNMFGALSLAVGFFAKSSAERFPSHQPDDHSKSVNPS